MADLNSISLTGRVTRDAELKTISSGLECCSFSLAVSGFKKDDVSFLDVTLWGKRAVSLNQFLTKGKQIALSGFIKQDRWLDKDGKSKSKITVTASDITLLGSKQEQDTEEIPF